MNKVDELMEKYPRERAVICHESDGFGIVIHVYSHEGKHVPHIHIFDINLKELGSCVLSDTPPKKTDDIKDFVGHGPVDDSIKPALIKWANSKREGLNMWRYARQLYRDINTYF